MQHISYIALSLFCSVIPPLFLISHPDIIKTEVGMPLRSNQQILARGKVMYNTACSPCHGTDGSGKGPLAANLRTQPRDLTRGVYKNRSTASGQLPTDYDLYHTITGGIHNTAMPFFRNIAPDDRWAIVLYIKTLSAKFADSNEYPLNIVDFGQSVPSSPQSLMNGRKIYIQMKCAECHGTNGQGDGPAAGTHTDDFGNPIGTTDLTNFSEYKFCKNVQDVFRIFSTGLNGAPMPSYAGTLSEEDRWHLANYVWALQNTDQYFNNGDKD